MSDDGSVATVATASVDLLWLPLGAGGRCVRVNGRIFEAVAARLAHRPPCDLYHAALEITVDGARHVVEMAPAWDRIADERGAVVEGPVGVRVAGRLLLFRYEIRCWRDGVIPDADEAVGAPVRLTEDPDRARRVVELTREVPAHVWGRDAVGCGDMWNSNSVVAWLLASTGLDAASVAPPPGGRAPGWAAGLVAASVPPAPDAVSVGSRRLSAR